MASRVDTTLDLRDPLGRWSGIGFRGRQGVTLCCLVAYRPNANTTAPGSVWSQQFAHYVSEEGVPACPLERFDQDLVALLARLLEAGHQVVLGIDANADLSHPTSPFRQHMESLNLTETILQQHGIGPATQFSGSRPIDGLFVSCGLRNLRCGYTGWISDHTGLYIDLPMQLALGHVLPLIVRPSMRRLKLQDPRVIRRYLDRYKALLQEQTVAAQLASLWETAAAAYDPDSTVSPLDDTELAQFAHIDGMCTLAMLEAERTCRKLFTGAVPWSPAYKHLRDELILLQTALRKSQGHQVSTYVLRRLAARVSRPEILRWSGRRLKRAVARQHLALSQFKKDLAAAARRTHNEKLVESISEATGQSAAVVLQQLIEREDSRLKARIIRGALKPRNIGAVSMVQTTTAEGQVKTWTSKRDIEAAIRRECHHRFRQASNTDFLTSPLFDRVGGLGVSQFCDRVLAGSFSPADLSGISEHATKLLMQLRRPTDLPQQHIDPIPDLETYRSRWRRQREQTASFPGRHFGHMMACVSDLELLEVHRQLEFLPILTGCPPPSWKKAINVMIEKKAGAIHVEKLRAICLFDCVANHCFKHLGKVMMSAAEARALVAPEQGGSRKGYRANYIGLEKRLSFDISRQLKRPMALCSNDARACYDRIVHSVASLSLQRVGMPKPAVICIFTTIQNLEHYVRTVFGDSEEYFADSNEGLFAANLPVSTIGQGNGAGPQIWALVSTPILNMLRQEGLGMFFKCTLSGEEVNFVGYAFVDDSDLGICSPHLPTFQDVAAEMQRSMDTWEGGLRATGGALAPEKTFWYLLDYKWCRGGNWSYKSERECPAHITVRDMHGQRQLLRRCDVSHAERTLGIYLAPDGSDDCQEQILRDKSVQWSKALRASRLPRHLAIHAYLTTIDKSLSYPLVATCLSPEQTAKIQSPALTAALQVAGVGKDMKLAVRFGPLSRQGLAMPDLFVTQLYSHIEALSFASESPGRNTSQLLRVSGELLKLELGLNGPLFDHNFQRLAECTTRSWMRFTWRWCFKYQISLRDSYPDFLPRREGDLLLMEAFNASVASPSELAILNRCRLFLRVVFLSDIVTGDGCFITEQAWQGQYDSSRISHYDWPTQGNPSLSCWGTWQKYVASCFCYRVRKLTTPLGRWIHEEPTTRFFYSPQMDWLCERTAQGWDRYLPDNQGRRRRSRAYRHRQQIVNIPQDLQRATVTLLSQDAIGLVSWGLSCPPNVPPTGTFQEALMVMLPANSRWILEHIQWPADTGFTIAEAIRTGVCIAVSDGSYNPVLQTGAAAMTIQGISHQSAIYGQCIAPGSQVDQSAYRSELAGLYQAVVVIHLLCNYYQIHEGVVELACDGLSALSKATACDNPTALRQPHFDLISATRALMRATKITWKTRHVLGHQREKHGLALIGPLDRWASLNDDMDATAKAHRLQYADPFPGEGPEFLFNEILPICLSNKKLSCQIHQALCQHILGPPLEEYWTEKGKFGNATPQDVDWQATEKAMSRLPASRRYHQSKMVSKFVAVRRRLQLREHDAASTCPVCLLQDPPVEVEETVSHLYTCPSTQQLWETRLDELDEWMVSVGTLDPVREVLLASFRAWRLNQPPPTAASIAIHRAVQAQLRLGWESAFEGRFANGWAAIQEDYYRELGAKPFQTGLRWLSMLIQKLFDVSWDLWEHRNGVLHQRSAGLRIRELRERVAQEFLTGPGLSRRLRELFKPGRAKICQRQAPQIDVWLYQVQVQRSIPLTQEELQVQQDEQTLRRQQHLMRHLFRPNQQTTTTGQISE